jgi:hypothetical protein
MRNSCSFVFAAFIAVCSCVSTKADSMLPENLDVPHDLVRMFEQLYSHSATFQAQCDRIAEAGHARVRVMWDMNIRSSCRAFTVFTRRRGVLCAEVHMPPSGILFAELIGHEFEHVLEQIEGLNLRALAKMRGSGVREVEAELFETDRAQRTGKIVADESRPPRAVRPAAN